MTTTTERKPKTGAEKIYITLFGAGLLLGLGLMAADRWGGPDVALGALSVLCIGLGVSLEITAGIPKLEISGLTRGERPQFISLGRSSDDFVDRPDAEPRS